MKYVKSLQHYCLTGTESLGFRQGAWDPLPIISSNLLAALVCRRRFTFLPLETGAAGCPGLCHLAFLPPQALLQPSRRPGPVQPNVTYFARRLRAYST